MKKFNEQLVHNTEKISKEAGTLGMDFPISELEGGKTIDLSKMEKEMSEIKLALVELHQRKSEIEKILNIQNEEDFSARFEQESEILLDSEVSENKKWLDPAKDYREILNLIKANTELLTSLEAKN